VSYGPNKYTGKQFLDALCGHIRAQLEKQGEFQNVSLGYFGIEFDYKINVRLLARGETNLTLTTDTAIIGTREDGTPDPDCIQAGLTATKEDVQAVVSVEGGSKAGTANQTQMGDHKKFDDDKRLRQRENVSKGSKEPLVVGKGTGGK